MPSDVLVPDDSVIEFSERGRIRGLHLICLALQREHVVDALWEYGDGEFSDPRFKDSTAYDLLYLGRRFPPKAIFARAAKAIIGRILAPSEFIGGKNSVCFKSLERLGFLIVPKGSGTSRTWLGSTLMAPMAVAFQEGALSLRPHLIRERSKKLRPMMLEARLGAGLPLTCDCCASRSPWLDDRLEWSSLEIHHVQPLSTQDGSVTTELDDLALLCANCHRAIHALMRMCGHWVSVDELRRLRLSPAVAA